MLNLQTNWPFSRLSLAFLSLLPNAPQSTWVVFAKCRFRGVPLPVHSGIAQGLPVPFPACRVPTDRGWTLPQPAPDVLQPANRGQIKSIKYCFNEIWQFLCFYWYTGPSLSGHISKEATLTSLKISVATNLWMHLVFPVTKGHVHFNVAIISSQICK